MPKEWLEAAMRKAEAAVLEQEEMEVSLLVCALRPVVAVVMASTCSAAAA